MRRIALLIAFVAAALVPSAASANALDDEYTWNGSIWVDKTCGTAGQTFRVDIYSNANLGGYRTRICGNEPNFCDVPMHPLNDFCNNPSVDAAFNDEMTSLDILDLPGGCGLQFTHAANYGGLDRVWVGEVTVNNVGASHNDEFSAVRLRCG